MPHQRFIPPQQLRPRHILSNMRGFFYSRSRGQTAAALHAKILDSTSDMWKQPDAPIHPPYFAKHMLGAGQLNTPIPLADTEPTRHFADVMFVAPNAFVKPQPRPSFSRILNWQDQTERCSPPSNTVSIPRRISVPVAHHSAHMYSPESPPLDCGSKEHH